MDGDMIAQREDLILDGDHDLPKGPSGKVGPPYGAGEKCIASKKKVVHKQADPPLCVARSRKDLERQGSHLDPFLMNKGPVSRRGGFTDKPKRGGMVPGKREKGCILFMDEQFGTCCIFQKLVRSHMIEMSMGVENIFKSQILLTNPFQYPFPIIPGVDDQGLLAGALRNKVAVHFQGAYGKGFHDHVQCPSCFSMLREKVSFYSAAAG
jgi:hypothetical protein